MGFTETWNGDRIFVRAVPGTGVDMWEISPCLENSDPRDGEPYTEAYLTLEQARDAQEDATSGIFWGVYAVMRAGFISDLIAPTMHIKDFDQQADAMEFVQALNGKEVVGYGDVA